MEVRRCVASVVHGKYNITSHSKLKTNVEAEITIESVTGMFPTGGITADWSITKNQEHGLNRSSSQFYWRRNTSQSFIQPIVTVTRRTFFSFDSQSSQCCFLRNEQPGNEKEAFVKIWRSMKDSRSAVSESELRVRTHDWMQTAREKFTTGFLNSSQETSRGHDSWMKDEHTLE